MALGKHPASRRGREIAINEWKEKGIHIAPDLMNTEHLRWFTNSEFSLRFSLDCKRQLELQKTPFANKELKVLVKSLQSRRLKTS
ncbi:hypothetical protein GDO81_020876 [Engystomops pustulosus]|uniref:Uncharacterized protein n=1 Tax=Engystomops pustulosus TaxID=76066 RepID=A0AAV6Z7J6_ENGPU|nr:hypothetical protein GDO81_020876 [Engystomops pustulosus]